MPDTFKNQFSDPDKWDLTTHPVNPPSVFPPIKKPEPATRVTIGERDKLLKAGVDPSAVDTLIRDRAITTREQDEDTKRAAIVEQQRVLSTEWEEISEEELDQTRNQADLDPEWEEVDDLEVFTDEQLVKDEDFSLEGYVTRHPDALQDNARTDRLANIMKERAKESIKVKDVAIGAFWLPWTGIKMVGKFAAGTGQTLYDVFSPPLAGALGAITGQDAEFDTALQQQTEKALAEDMAGFEKGSLGFTQWLARSTTTLPRRWGFSDWDSVSPEKLREEFRNAMADFEQLEEVGVGRGEFSRAIGGETLKEIEDRGETLDPERVARVAEADMAGFFLFGQAFRVGLAGVTAGVGKAAATKTAIRGKALGKIRNHVNRITRNMPKSSPTRQLSEQMLAQAERNTGAFEKTIAAISRTADAAEKLGAAQARLGGAQAAARRFATAEAREAVEVAQAALLTAQETARGAIGARAVASLQSGIGKLTKGDFGGTLGEKVAGAGLRTAGRVAQAGAKVVETSPTTAGIGALLSGNIGMGVALLVGGRAAGLNAIAKGAARPLRAAQDVLAGTGRSLSRGLPNTPFQKAIKGISQGAGDIAVGGLKGMPIDIGFALILAESPEDVKNMSGYGTTFGGLHQLGRPMSRYTQALLTGRQQGVIPAFVAPRGGVLREAQSASQAGRALLSNEQRQRLASMEQFTNEMGSDTPYYIMPDKGAYRQLLGEQFTRKEKRVPSTAEAAVLDNISEQRGIFLEEIIGDRGELGSAIFVTDMEAVPHEGQHDFQRVLGESGNEAVDKIIMDHYADQWDTLGAEYAVAATGDPAMATQWREYVNTIAPESLRQEAGDPVTTADVFLAREIGAENFATLFDATGGRPQGDQGLLQKLAIVADRVGKYLGVDVLAGHQTPGGIGIASSGEVLNAIQRAAQKRAGAISQGTAEATPGGTPSFTLATPPVRRPTSPAPPAAGAAAAPPTTGTPPVALAGPQRPPSVRPPRAGPEDAFEVRTPERINAEMAREYARTEGTPEMERDVETMAQALQRNPGEAVVFEAENLSVVPGAREAGFDNILRRAEQAMPEAARAFFTKKFSTTRFIKDQFSGGKLQVMAMSLDKVMANVYTLHRSLSKAGVSELSPWQKDAKGNLSEAGWDSAIADITSYTKNQANGYRGGGKEIIRPGEAQESLGLAIPEVNENYRPQVLPEGVEAFVNVIMGLATPKTTREFKGTVPGNVKGQVLRELQGETTVTPSDIKPKQVGKRFKSFPERELQETNLLRDQMKQQGVADLDKLFPVTERMNMERIKNVTPRFDFEFNLPVTDVIRGGFLPAVREAPLTELAQKVFERESLELRAGTSAAESGKSWQVEAFDPAGNRVGRVRVEETSAPNKANVEDFQVQKDSRGRGIGGALFREISKRVQTDGVELLTGDIISPEAVRSRARVLPKTEFKDALEEGVISQEQAVEQTSPGSLGVRAESNLLGAQLLPKAKTLADPAKFSELSTDAQAPREAPAKFEFLPEMTKAEQIEIANKTARAAGSVGARPTLTTQAVMRRAKPGESVLDFGAGPKAKQAEILRTSGFSDVTAHEFGTNARQGVHDPVALERGYDTVFASNVLNVQSTKGMLNETLSQISDSVNPEGKALFNYPNAPRKMTGGMTAAELKTEIGKHFESVEKISGKPAAPIFEARGPIAQETSSRPAPRERADRLVGEVATETKRLSGNSAEGKAIAEALQEKGIPAAPDGATNGGLLVQSLPREWKQWLNDKWYGEPVVKKYYSKGEMDSFASGLEATAKLFGDFSTVPKEFKGTSPLRENSDRTFEETLDFTTVCPKQDQFVAITRTLEREQGRLFTPVEKSKVGEMLRTMGSATCWVCYGQNARNQWEGAVQKSADLVTKASTLDRWTKLGEGTKEDQVAAKAFFKGATQWADAGVLRKFIDANFDEIKAAGGINDVRLRDLLRDETKPENDFERGLMKAVNTVARSAGVANVPKGFAPYTDQILSPKFKKKIEKYNKVAGLRMNSQSDFRIWQTLDMAQVLGHLKTQGGMAHVYTRIPEFVDVFGKTGIKFNASVEVQTPINVPVRSRRGDMTAKEFRELHKEHGEPVWDSMNSFPEEQAKGFRKKLSKDFGTMLMAADEYQLWWGLDNPNIDMIIPYHQGAVPPETSAFYGAKDFSSQQHDNFPLDWKPGETRTAKLPDGTTTSLTMESGGLGKGKNKTRLRKYPIITREHHKNKRENYLAMAEQMGFSPRFERMSSHPNYMKLIRDVARDPSNQKVVNPAKIDWDANARMVDTWVKSGKFDEETKPNPKMLEIVRDLWESNELPVSPLVQAGVAKSVDEILGITARSIAAEKARTPIDEFIKPKKKQVAKATDIKPKKKGK